MYLLKFGFASHASRELALEFLLTVGRRGNVADFAVVVVVVVMTDPSDVGEHSVDVGVLLSNLLGESLVNALTRGKEWGSKNDTSPRVVVVRGSECGSEEAAIVLVVLIHD